MNSIKNNVINTYIIEKSEFITYLFPVTSVEEANDYLKTIRKKHYDANHNCYAYIIGLKQDVQKCSDDGEPSKTAGFPILNTLKSHQLTNVLCIVTRYFGGIKLGAGGLIRAYTKSASLALLETSFTKLTHFIEFTIIFPYHYISSIDKNIIQNQRKVVEKTYLEDVTYLLHILVDDKNSFITSINELTNGCASILIRKEFSSFE